MDINHRIKASEWFKALARMGPELPSEYGKYLRDGVWELRVIIQHHQHRFLYGYWKNIIIVTNAFLKKSHEVPAREIERSMRAASDWVGRQNGEDL